MTRKLKVVPPANYQPPLQSEQELAALERQWWAPDGPAYEDLNVPVQQLLATVRALWQERAESRRWSTLRERTALRRKVVELKAVLSPVDGLIQRLESHGESCCKLDARDREALTRAYRALLAVDG